MATSAVEQAKKENGVSLKSLLPVIAIGTVVVLAVALTGRIVTSK